MIRSIDASDWRLWRDLQLRAFAEPRTMSDAEWQASIGPLCLVADDVGMARVAVAPDGLRARLSALWVAPEARQRGVEEALVAAAGDWCRARGVCELADGAHVRRIQTLVMGVVNVTPDSFSDGGQFLDPASAVAHGRALAEAGADILDVGGEATNPRATSVDAAEELRRVLPVIEGLAAAGLRVSIDTTKAEVARRARAAGATIINDVSGGCFDVAMPDAIGDATYIVGHLRGRSLAEVFAVEAGVTWEEVAGDLAARLAVLDDTARERAWVDPGVGFGKGGDPAVNLALLRHAGDLGRALDRPVVVGPSRKRFVRRAFAVHDGDTRGLDDASVTLSLEAVAAGANVVRVHNVALLRAALALYTKQ